LNRKFVFINFLILKVFNTDSKIRAALTVNEPLESQQNESFGRNTSCTKALFAVQEKSDDRTTQRLFFVNK
jgi:hypothetical protein